MNINLYYNYVYIFNTCYLLILASRSPPLLTRISRLQTGFCGGQSPPAPKGSHRHPAHPAPSVGRSGGCTLQGQGRARSLPARCPVPGTPERTPAGSPHPPSTSCHETLNGLWDHLHFHRLLLCPLACDAGCPLRDGS